METSTAREALQQAVDNIEGGYEFLLAYAAQGLATDQGNANSEQLRAYLKRLDDGIAGLEVAVRSVIAGREDEATFEDVLAELARDAAAARAALKVVTSRPGISSQLVDNLNASTHIRSLLTDLFLIDEAVKTID